MKKCSLVALLIFGAQLPVAVQAQSPSCAYDVRPIGVGSTIPFNYVAGREYALM